MPAEKNQSSISEMIRALKEECWRSPDDARSEKLIEANPWLESMFPDLEKPEVRVLDLEREIRILMVADGGNLNYGNGTDDRFGLGKLLSIVSSPSLVPPVKFSITTAHRGEPDKQAQIHRFKFDTKPDPPNDVELSHYHQIWLFGMATTPPITPSEIEALAMFMDKGGVFATGDHASLGRAMCGSVPRVRSMRIWEHEQTPSAIFADRLETLREGEPFSSFGPPDELDGIPQVIHPTHRIDSAGVSLGPHPLLQMEGGRVIRVLPDHMHEGMCVVPDKLEEPLLKHSSTGGDEYPKHPTTGERIKPEIVALSTSPSWHFPFEREQASVNPRCFGAICAYGGSSVGKGNVVVDSSFHHFTNGNLKHFDSPDREPENFAAIQRYFRNIRDYLIPPGVKRLQYLQLLITVRYLYPLVEELLPLKDAAEANFLEVGALTNRAIANLLSPSESTHCALSFIGWPETQSIIETVINPWSSASRPADKMYYLFNPEVIRTAILGDVMTTILSELPEDPLAVRESLLDLQSKDSGLETVVTANVKRRVVDNLTSVVEETGRQFSSLMDAFTR